MSTGTIRQALLPALLSLSLFGSFAAQAKQGGAPAGGAKAGKPDRGAGKPNCPAANRVNTPAQDTLGCPVLLPRTFGPQWEPATKADFIKQSGGRPFGEVKGQGMGGIRCVKFIKKKAGKVAKLYRLYGGGAGQYGGYWTFEDYAAGDAYRKKMAICKNWNDFSAKVTCTLGANTNVVIAVGPGQSVGQKQNRGRDGKVACTNVCADINEKYPASKDLQVVMFGGQNLCGKP